MILACVGGFRHFYRIVGGGTLSWEDAGECPIFGLTMQRTCNITNNRSFR